MFSVFLDREAQEGMTRRARLFAYGAKPDDTSIEVLEARVELETLGMQQVIQYGYSDISLLVGEHQIKRDAINDDTESHFQEWILEVADKYQNR